MRTRSILSAGATVAAALALTACGGGTAKTSASAGATAGNSKPDREFVVSMSGRGETPAGAPSGVGAAVIAFHDRAQEICWRFAHLHGFSGATYAHIHRGALGRSGPIVVALSTGPALHHRGCVKTTATLMAVIAKDPGAYYVNVHSTKYPNGAIRGQL